MTDARGPDFLPYPLPNRTIAPAAVVMPAPVPAHGRWRRALEGLTPAGVVALSAAIVALLVLLLVSLVTDHRQAGAVLTCLAAAVAVSAGVRALKDEQPADSRALVKGSIWTSAAAAVVALLLLLGSHSSVAEQPPVQVPSPQPTATQEQPQPTPTPSASPQPGTSGTPTPGQLPGLGVLPPGSSDLFGLPSEPGPPQSQDPAAKGRLTGRVVTTSGTGVAGAVVTITRSLPGDTSGSPGCPVKVIAKTNDQGRYDVQLCQLGDNLGYHVVVSSGGASATTDLFVNSGQTTVYNVILAIRHA